MFKGSEDMVNVLPNYVQSQNARDESALINHLKFLYFTNWKKIERERETTHNATMTNVTRTEYLRGGPRHSSSQASAVCLGLGAL